MAIRIPNEIPSIDLPVSTPIFYEVQADFAFFRKECEHGLSKWLCEGPNHYLGDGPFDDFPF